MEFPVYSPICHSKCPNHKYNHALFLLSLINGPPLAKELSPQCSSNLAPSLCLCSSQSHAALCREGETEKGREVKAYIYLSFLEHIIWSFIFPYLYICSSLHLKSIYPLSKTRYILFIIL